MTTNNKKLLSLVRLAPLQTRDEAIAIAVETARLQMEKEKVALLRDEKIEALNLEFNLQLESLSTEEERNIKRLSAWAVANRQEEFGDKQGITLAGHKLQFRKGNGKVEFVPGVTAGDALDKLLSHEDEAVTERFVAIKTDLNKQAMIAAWKNPEYRAVLESVGICVTKAEAFSFEADRDAVPDAAPVAVGKEVA